MHTGLTAAMVCGIATGLLMLVGLDQLANDRNLWPTQYLKASNLAQQLSCGGSWCSVLLLTSLCSKGMS